MSRQKLLDPKNITKGSTGGFKEGNVAFSNPEFVVHLVEAKANADGTQQEQRAAFVALKLDIARLDEDMAPLNDDDGEQLKETIFISLGGKSLAQMHPGKADSADADDSDVDDAGSEIGDSGPTVFLVNKNAALHEASGFVHFTNSAKGAGMKPADVDCLWAPKYDGMVCHLGNEPSSEMKKGKDGKDYPSFSYKVITKIHSMGGKAKKAAPVAGKAAPAAVKGTGKKAPVEDADTKIDNLIVEGIKVVAAEGANDYTIKGFASKVSNLCQRLPGYDAKSLVPLLSKVKDVNWLAAHSEDLGYEFDGETVTFPGE